MSTPLTVLLSVFWGLMPLGFIAAQERQEPHQTIAKAFEGMHRFNYLFIEDGVPYLDISSHMQVVETREDQENEATHVAFYHPTPDGKRLHFRYVIQSNENNVTLQEFDASGQHRFDCVGTYQPEKKLLQCSATKAPKPARDLDSPLTRQLGLFKRPPSWPAYATLDRHNIFRFYDWGIMHIQENVKVDEAGHAVARETGVISVMRVQSPSGPTVTKP
jgi:hypothetical protein